MRVIVAFLFFLFFVFSVNAQTQIAAGNVSGAWYKANSPYIINGDIVVQPGTSLTINPGVKVLFNGHFALTVKGSLTANGTAVDSILFSRNAQTVASKGRGIKLVNASGSSSFSYCKIEQQYETTNDGAGISVNTSVVNILNSVISNNISDFVGAGIRSYDGGKSVLIRNCLIANNTVTGTGNFIGDGGAGLYIGGDNTILTNCIITKNVFSNASLPNFEGGGGISVWTGSPYIVNNTIFLNSAYKGSGIHVYQNATPKIINNIVWSNSGSVNSEQISIEPDYSPIAYDTKIVISNNDIQNNGIVVLARNDLSTFQFTTGVNNFSAAPKFVSNTDFHLQSASPCINKGLTTISGFTFPVLDFAGSTRIQNATVDLGAYETSILTSGDVFGIWTKANSPYLIYGECTVPANKSLVIEPGVKVLYTGNFALTVKGQITANGTVQDSILFDRNASASSGNGIKLESASGTSEFSYCIIQNQYEATRSGAGLSSVASAFTIQNSVIRNNISDNFGAGIYSEDGNKDVLIKNCLITGNTVTGLGNYNAQGGAGLNIGGDKTIVTNCVITKNVFIYTSAPNFEGGGGLTVTYGSPYIVNNTITLNSAIKGSGIHMYGTSSSPKIINNIVWSNTGSKNGEQISIEPEYSPMPYSSSIVISYNDIQNNGIVLLARNDLSTYTFTTGVNNVNADPKFINSTTENFALQSTSPCIGKGQNTISGFTFPYEDYFGHARIQNATIEIGAYEYGNAMPTGIDEIEFKAPEIAIYPIPANDIINVIISSRINWKSLEIINMAGIVVSKIENKGINQISLNVSEYTSGMYFVAISTDTQRICSKLNITK